MRIRVRWGWMVGLLSLLGAALVIAFVLSFSGTGSGSYEREFVWLFWVNVAVAVLLTVVLAAAGLRLFSRLRKGRFGSRLLLRLAGIFALVGVLPGLVIYTVSYQFASRSIEAWFDVRVASALDAGLALGKGTLESMQADAMTKTSAAALRLADLPQRADALTLEQARERIGARDVSLVGPAGQVLLTAGGSAMSLAPERPSTTLLRQARAAGQAVQVEGVEDDAKDPRIRVVAWLPHPKITLAADEDRFLFAVLPLPKALVTNALQVQSAYSEYQERALARDSLRRMYIGTLTLALILAVFGAVLLALVLGNQIVRPLLLLADGVRQVAAGDLRAKPVWASSDELGGLTQSFADMTQQVADARAQAEASLRQLESARTRLQTILDNLTPGVIVFDRLGRIDTVNPGVTRILRIPMQAWTGRPLEDVPGLQEFGLAVAQRFETLKTAPEEGERGQWQDSFVLNETQGAPQTGPAAGLLGGSVTLLARGAWLPGDASLLVFDDITEVISAQRAQAWAEVARRLAHEIKNPLTPIQLSAERLQQKLENRLEGSDQSLLIRSVSTIVNQVQAMKTLVNEFRDYARLPSAQPVPLSLNDLVAEVLSLYGDAQDSGCLASHLEGHLPWVQGDATQLRQVVHNLVQNALDAVADRAQGRVEVTTESVRAEDGAVRGVRLAVVDNGPGFADHVLKRAFEPYVTTKTRGTGLGLAVVKKIADEHRARIRVMNLHAGAGDEGPIKGARVSLSFSILAPEAPTGVGAQGT